MSIRDRLLSLLAALLFSSVVVLPFLGEEAERGYAFEIEIAADGSSGNAQVFFDLGRQFNENDSAVTRLPVGNNFVTVRFPMPGGIIQHLRFDPTDRPGALRFRNARIVTKGGKVLHEFEPGDFSPVQQITEFRTEGGVTRLTVPTGAVDPIITVRLDGPLRLWARPPIVQFLAYAGPVFAGLILAMLVTGRRSETTRHRLRTLVTSALARPVLTLAIIAGLATMLSSYPVVFLGKSYVSPNFQDGTYLLYDHFPTLPGYADVVTEHAQGADVGAIIWQQVPYSFVQSDALVRDHELPLWNRYNSCGTVLLGQGQSMFGDPFHLPVILARGAAWAWDLKYLIAKWLLCFGLGLAALWAAKDFSAAAVTALSSAFLGFFIYRLNHPAFFSFCYSPWILCAWIKLSTTREWKSRFWCLLGLLAADFIEINSGTVKEAYMLVLGLNLTGAVVVLFSENPWKRRISVLAAAAWTGVIFALLTAPTWVTLARALSQSYSAYDAPTAFQIQPTLLLGLFDEVFYRPIQHGNNVSNPSANFAVLIGVLYFLTTFRESRSSRVARALATSAVIPLALAFGVIPPDWIIKIPLLRNVAHIDNSFSCVLIVILVVLAAFGWAAAFKRLGTPEGRHDLIRITWAYLALASLWIGFMQVVHRPTFGTEAVVSLLRWGQHVQVSDFVWLSYFILPIAALILLLTLRHALMRRTVSFAGSLLILLSMLVLLWRHGMHTRQVGPDTFVFTPSVRADFHTDSPALVALRADQHEPGRVAGIGNNLFPGWSSDYRIEGITGADALINRNYRELQDALGLSRLWDWRLYVDPAKLADMKAALDFFNVRHYIGGSVDPVPPAAGLAGVASADLDVYRSSTAWPRAFFADRALVYDNPTELRAKVQAAQGAPFAAIQRADVSDLPRALIAENSVALVRRARDYALTANTTTFTIDATGPGLAVLQEAWLKRDFIAKLDGKPVPYLRVNHAFKAILVPSAGSHRIEFEYWPRGFTWALTAAGLGCVLLIASGCAVWLAGRSAARLSAHVTAER